MLVTSVILALGEVDVRESGVQNHPQPHNKFKTTLGYAHQTKTNYNKRQDVALHKDRCLPLLNEKEAVSGKFPSPRLSQVWMEASALLLTYSVVRGTCSNLYFSVLLTIKRSH